MRLRLVLLLYNLLLPVGLLVLLPASLLKMRRRGGYGRKFWQRFGTFDRETAARLEAGRGRAWWLHAVSVGEVNVARRLIDEIVRREPDRPLILSVTTSTGFAVATAGAPESLTVIYSPVDLPPVVRRVLRRAGPGQLVLVEAEVWPNLVAQAKRSGIPVTLANARLSPRSERRFRRFRALAAPVFGMLDAVLVQEPEDAARWQGIGARPDVVQVTGSVKFDPAGTRSFDPQRRDEFRAMLDSLWPTLTDPEFAILASTHNGEEVAIAGALTAALRTARPQLRLLVAPRHAERRAAVRAGLEAAGYRVALRSNPADAPPAPDILVIDSTGELRDWQALASVVVIGKSFLARGGQNPAEAIAAGIPVVAGPHMENFQALTGHLLRAGGICQVAGVEFLAEAVGSLLADPAAARAMADRAAAALDRHRGATVRTVDLLAAAERSVPAAPSPRK